MIRRPFPPESLIDSVGSAAFVPSPDLREWARECFIAEDADLVNEDYAHLRDAAIGWLWTNTENTRKGKLLLGTCQLMPPSGEKWAAARAVTQIESWFGDVPDFLITLYAPACAAMDEASFMALVEHELHHAGQKNDKYGSPAFNNETGQPIFEIKGHDVEEFIEVVRRYGADATGTREMVNAANQGPTISEAKIRIACGTCLRVVG